MVSSTTKQTKKNYFFFNVKNPRFLPDSSLVDVAAAGIVWAREEDEEGPSAAVVAAVGAGVAQDCNLLTQPFMSSSSLAWNRYSPPLDNLRGNFQTLGQDPS